METENTLLPKQVFSRVGLAMLTFLGSASVLQIVFSVVIGVAQELGAAWADADWLKWLVTFIPMYAFGFPLCLVVMKTAPKAADTRDVKLGGKNFFILLLMCFPIMYAGNLIGTLLSLLFSGSNAENPLMNYAYDTSIIKVLVMVFIGPFAEEYVCRKMVIDRCRPYGEKTAILFSAVTFGLFHGNLYQFFYAFGLGLLFAYVYTRTGRLRYSCLMHMVINFFGSVLAPWVVSSVDLEALSDMTAILTNEAALAEILPGLLLYLGYFLLLIGLSVTGLVLLIVKAKRFVFQPAALELEAGSRFRTVYLNVGFILFFVICLGLIVASLFLT